MTLTSSRTSGRSQLRVLSLTFGIRHDDWEQTTREMEAFGIEAIFFNLSNNILDSIDLNEFDAVDLRHCRGWQLRWDDFTKAVARLETLGLPMINSPSMFRWVLNKSSYLDELQGRGIRIVPTALVRAGDEVRLQDYLNKDNKHFVVVKPDRGARATGIRFIRRFDEDTFEIVEPHKAGNSTSIVNSQQLEVRFALYRHQAHEGKLLVQNYVPEGREISAVFIDGQCRMVETTKPLWPGALVAHDEHGGQNIPLSNVDPALMTFAEDVIHAMPDDVRCCPYLRIDTIQAGNEIYLLEIEGGTPRLFLKETERAGEYAAMIKHRASLKRRRMTSNLPIDIAIVGGGLAGLTVLASLVRTAVSKKHSGLKIIIFERADETGPGPAYSPSLPDSFILNHEIDDMGSVNVDLKQPDASDFSTWYRNNLTTLRPLYPNYNFDKNSTYVPRSMFGRYLIARFDATKAFAERHGIEITESRNEVSNIRRTARGLEVDADGHKRIFDKVILATGNWFKENSQKPAAAGAAYSSSSWQAYTQNEMIPNNAAMLISGSGLSAYDTAILALDSGKYSQVIIASRRGHLRRVRGRYARYTTRYLTIRNLEKLSGPHSPFRLAHIQALLRKELEHAYGRPVAWKESYSSMEIIDQLRKDVSAVEAGDAFPWRSVYSSIPDSVRHEIYSRLADEDRKEFLEKYYSLYQSYHAPMPLTNAKRLLDFFDDGRLILVSGVSAQSIEYDKTTRKFELMCPDSAIGSGRDTGLIRPLRADVWVNATGLGRDIRSEPLYANLISQGLAEVHPDGGVRTDLRTRQLTVNGRAHNDIYALGTMSCGETVLTHNSLQISLYGSDLGRAIIEEVAVDRSAAENRSADLEVATS